MEGLQGFQSEYGELCTSYCFNLSWLHLYCFANISHDSSIRWTSFWNKFGNEVLSQELSHDESIDSLGDDASVVSTSSGVSTLSIDYNFVENPALKGDKVDLSN